MDPGTSGEYCHMGSEDAVAASAYPSNVRQVSAQVDLSEKIPDFNTLDRLSSSGVPKTVQLNTLFPPKSCRLVVYRLG
jgi:hypothetical protein